MDLTPYVENLRNELAVAAATGGDEARALAERLTLPLESAVRLTLLNALSAAMGEVTRDLAPGSVDVRLRGLDPEFVVTAPPGADAFHGEGSPVEPPVAPSVAPPVAPSASPVVPEADEAGTARINLRLPANLKAWLVRAVAGAVEGGRPVARPAAALGSRTTRSVGGQGFTGWVH